MKNFRSLLALAAITASVTASTPAQAVTWDEVWNTVKQGLQDRLQQQGSSNDSEATQKQSQPSSAQRNYTEQSSSAQPAIRQTPPQMLVSRCTKVTGNDYEFIDRDSQESMISIGRRALKVNWKLDVSNHLEMTCAIERRPSSGKARFVYVIADNSNLESMRVSIFVDGQEKSSGVIYRGQGRGFAVDISRASSYAVILKAINAGNLYEKSYLHLPTLPPAAYY
jgi:hypothetical protein